MRPRDVAEMGEGKWWGVGRKTNKARPSGQKAEASWGEGRRSVFIRYLEKHDKLPLLREIF